MALRPPGDQPEDVSPRGRQAGRVSPRGSWERSWKEWLRKRSSIYLGSIWVGLPEVVEDALLPLLHLVSRP